MTRARDVVFNVPKILVDMIKQFDLEINPEIFKDLKKEELKKRTKPNEREIYKQNVYNYFNNLRKIDLMWFGVFYGIFISKKLPNLVEPDGFEIVTSKENQRFNAKMEKELDIIANILFLLWIANNNIKENPNYRIELYTFLEKVLDFEFVKKVIIPFYLSKANERTGGAPSYLEKLAGTQYIIYETGPITPEYLISEFYSVKEEFEEFLIEELNDWTIEGVL